MHDEDKESSFFLLSKNVHPPPLTLHTKFHEEISLVASRFLLIHLMVRPSHAVWA